MPKVQIILKSFMTFIAFATATYSLHKKILKVPAPGFEPGTCGSLLSGVNALPGALPNYSPPL